MTISNHPKVALLTGAAGGLGQVFATALAAQGFRLALVGREATLGALHERCREQDRAYACDLADPLSIARLSEQVLADFGRVDVLINNAAWIPLKPLAETSLEDWRECHAVNLDAPFLLGQAFIPGMREQGWGRIINLSSSNTGRPQKGFAAYIASKMGVIGLTRAMAAELGDCGITANAISPGLIRHAGSAANLPAELFGKVRDSQLIPRTGEPEDLCGVLAFLASDASGYMTGQVFNLDGGFLF